jgi:C4-dicarboxylate-specific signal transduction histidine kinase
VTDAGAARARHTRALRRLALAVLAVAAIAACGWAGHAVSEARALHEQRRDASHRLDLVASAVAAIVKRLEHVPSTVQLNRDVKALLQDPGDRELATATNDYLRRLNASVGSLAVYAVNDRGVVVASSNDAQSDDSRVGTDLSFRPYFLDALSGRVGRHFAIGLGDAPGYFVSHPVHDGARVTGVVAIKISLEPVNELWDTLSAPALVADANRVVILSSRPAWRYTALGGLPVERRVDLQLGRVYDGTRVGDFPVPLAATVDDDVRIAETVLPGGFASLSPGGAGTLVLGRSLDGMDWRLMTFTDLAGVRAQAVTGAFVGALLASLLALAALLVQQRRRIARQRLASRALLERANADLEQRIAERTADLTAANERLRGEIAVRAHAEGTLRETQAELVHAAKLAMLGQIASGITHELAQPLGAIRTLSGNAVEFLRRGELTEVPGNLDIVARLADQMGRILQPLKRFARKASPKPEPVDVAQAVAHVLQLYGFRLRREGVEVDDRCRPGAAVAWCEPTRLEQILGNLVSNAIDAMAGQPTRRLTLEATLEPGDAERSDGTVRIRVADTGPGFGAEAGAQLFDPFYTSKAAGQGLGLGLTISRDIARESGGELHAASTPAGAVFTLRLPRVPAEARRAPAAAAVEETAA